MTDGRRFQVIRVEKLKSAARVAGRIRHALRGHVPPNADPARGDLNGYVIPGNQPAELSKIEGEERKRRALDRWRKLLPPKYRKDAVTCLEFLVTGSREAMEAMGEAKARQYLRESAAWIWNRFGGLANVVCGATHRDETTTHLSLFVVPTYQNDRGESCLSAKHYIDGPKALADLQTDFNREVASRYGLERGEEHSAASHTSVKEFYRVGAEVMREKQRELAEAKKARREARRGREEGR